MLSEAEFENEKVKLLEKVPPGFQTGGSTVYPSNQPAYNQPAYNQQVNMGYNQTISQEQTGLIVAAYICAVVSLLFCPLVLGIIGMILGFYAKSQGDDRGTLAGIVSLVCMIIGMFIGMLVWNEALGGY